MSKWVSYGYSPPAGPGARQAREIEEELLREYFPLIVANSELILETPRYFYCQLAAAWLSSMWLYGGGPIPLGILVLLWDAGEMRFECPSCGGSLYAIGVCGSVLSGSGTAWGICSGCRQNQWKRGSCASAIHAVAELLSHHRNEPIIEKGKQPRFDWKDGLKGESTPDRVVVPAVEPVNIWALIVRLRSLELADGGEEGELMPEPGPKYQVPQPIRRGFTYPIPLERKRR